MTYAFHPEAQNEFHDAAHWYEDKSVLAGDRFVEAVRAAVNLILNDPSRYQSIADGIRVFRLKKYPFRLYYEYDEKGQHVYIYALMHEKRQPDYWRKRVSD